MHIAELIVLLQDARLILTDEDDEDDVNTTKREIRFQAIKNYFIN